MTTTLRKRMQKVMGMPLCAHQLSVIGYRYFHIDYAIRLRYLVYSSYYKEQSYREI